MKKLYFFLFFVYNFISTFSSEGSVIDVNTKLSLIKPTKIKIQKMSDKDVLVYKLDNLEGDLVKIYVKEAEAKYVKVYNKKDINGKLMLNPKKNGLKQKATVRVMYN